MSSSSGPVKQLIQLDQFVRSWQQPLSDDQSARLLQEIIQLRRSLACSICLEVVDRPAGLPCRHFFCQECISRALAVKLFCPMCNRPIAEGEVKGVECAVVAEALHWFKKLLPKLEVLEAIPLKNGPSQHPLNNNNSNKQAAESPLPCTTLKEEPSTHPNFEPGTLVNVLPRTWIGINKLGGVAWVKSIDQNDEGDLQSPEVYYSVKYVLDGKHEVGIPAIFVEKFEELDRGNRSTRKTLRDTTNTFNSNVPAARDDHASSAQDCTEMTIRHKKRPAPTDKENKNDGSSQMIPNQSVTKSTKERLFEDSKGSAPKEIVILTTALDSSKPGFQQQFEKKLEALCQHYPFVSVVSRFSDRVTHVVCSVDRNGIIKQRTMKYMQAVARGIWVVSTQWIVDSLKRVHDETGVLADEGRYEVISDPKAAIPGAPAKSRERKKKDLSLLRGFEVLLAGSYPLPGPPRSDLEDLLRSCGAQIFTSLQDFKDHFTLLSSSNRKYIVLHSIYASTDEIQALKSSVAEKLHDCQYNMPIINDFPIISSLWLMDSISNYQLQPFEPYKA